MGLIMHAAITALVQLTLDKVVSYLQNGFGFFSGEKDDLEKIKASLITIRSVIGSAEEHPWKDQDLVEWLEKLKDAAYDADDVLDEYTTQDLRQKVEAQNINSIRVPVTNKVRKIASSDLNYPNRKKMTLKLKEIRKRLESIEGESQKLSERVQKWDRSEVYGRDKEKEKIVHHLLLPVLGHEDENVSVIPIVGMGGLGKTTLAQLVFNDDTVHDHFKLKMWVSVSDDFDIKRLMKKIVRQATRRDSKLSDLDLEELQHGVREALIGRKFLLVLDDVWNEEQEKWDRLRDLLMCGGRGSRIVVTTRNPMIASIMSRIEPHHLEGLSEEDCWKLFDSRAFRDHKERDHPKLVEIRKNIVSKCKGVPLAVITLGSLLLDKKESEWMSIRDSEFWNLDPQNVHGILPALRLSYYHLNPHLRQCFVFCAIFPKGYNMDKELLIQLWMAHGCVPSKRGMELEDIGIEILNELLMRSLFQKVKDEDDDDSSLKIKVHDLVHDLAQSVVGNDCCIIESGKSDNFTEKVRHLSYFQISGTLPEFLSEAHESLRTFVVLDDCYFVVPQDMAIFKFLRVLHLGMAIDDQPLPTSLGELIHLRYLGLSTDHIETLPESTGNLHNLQTLNLFACLLLRELPKGTRNLINLRCLDISHCNRLSHMPAKIGMLSCLRKLPLFVVGDDAGVCSGIEELQCLNLRANLKITHLERVSIPSYAQRANLIEKPNLNRLHLSWFHRFVDNGNDMLNIQADEDVLKSLQPHENLKELKISGYRGIHFPSWMMGSLLPKIEKISFKYCKRCETLPPLGQLPSLKFLHIKCMNRLENIDSEFYGNDMSEGFPLLEKLKIENIPSLKIWSELHGERVFPSLQILTIRDCTNLKSLPEGIGNLSSLKELYLFDVGLTSLPESVQKLSTLRKLCIRNCPQLQSLQEGIGSLSSLKKLDLENVGLTSLPESMQELSTLSELSIRSCHQLPSLPEWVGSLTTLQFLTIKDCPQMVSLPEGLQRLTRLQILSIDKCPELYRRCVETREDLHKIQHVPEIQFWQ